MFRESEPLLGWHVVAPQKGNTDSADRWVNPVLTGHNPTIVVDSQSHFHSLRHSLRIGCSFLLLNVAYIPTYLICPGPCSVIPQVALFAVGHIWATFHHFHQVPGLSWRMIFYPNLLQLLVVYTRVLVAFVCFCHVFMFFASVLNLFASFGFNLYLVWLRPHHVSEFFLYPPVVQLDNGKGPPTISR